MSCVVLASILISSKTVLAVLEYFDGESQRLGQKSIAGIDARQGRPELGRGFPNQYVLRSPGFGSSSAVLTLSRSPSRLHGAKLSSFLVVIVAWLLLASQCDDRKRAQPHPIIISYESRRVSSCGSIHPGGVTFAKS